MERLLNPTRLAEYLGVSREYLRLWRLEADFPKPVRGKLWDIKAIEQFLDKKSGIKSSEPDYEALFRGDLHGEHKGGIPYNPHT